jgi:hypothetical protein
VNRLLRDACPAAVSATLSAAVLAGLAAPAGVLAQSPSPALEPARPNIVMVMIDDTNPHDGRLFSAPYMPNLD